MNSRTLAWDGYLNLRDLGGLPTPMSESGATSFGRVARGPRRESMTEHGWAQARSWGLRTVIDLRCAHEVGRRDEDPDVAAAATDGIAFTNAPTEDQTDAEFRRVCFPILDSPAYWAHNWRLLPQLVRATFEAIADSAPGILVHCSAGRDRTGMISALLLGNAGVTADAVVADYSESVRVMAGTDHHGPTTDSSLSEQLPIVADVADRAPEILAQLGVSAATRRRLRSILVAPS